MVHFQKPLRVLIYNESFIIRNYLYNTYSYNHPWLLKKPVTTSNLEQIDYILIEKSKKK